MKPRAGSASWLLMHEVRMFFYNAGFGSKKGAPRRGIGKGGLALWIGAAFALHGFAFFLLDKLDTVALKAPHAVVMGLTGVFAAAVSMMLATGLKSSVEVLFERGDLDLLLSSPLSSRSIFTVRLAGIVVAVCGIYLFFLAPFAHVGMALGQFHWLGIYPLVLGTSAVAASLSMLLTLGLVRMLGVRRTRVVAQVLGALSGAMFFLVSQLFANSMGNLGQRVAGWFAPMLAPGAALGPDSAIWLPGRAMLGAAGPLLGISILALAMFALTVRFTHRFFVHGVQQAVSMVRAAEAPRGGARYHFGRSLTRVVVIKEWRLIARDPQLISQVLLQLLYMLPLCFVLLVKGGLQLAGTGAALTFLCASLTTALAWVIISAEDAPDLLRAAPCSMGTIRRAKLAAVTIPALAIVGLPLLWVLARDPLAGILMGASVGASVASSALIAIWCGRPGVRGEFKTRAKGNFLTNALEMLNAFAWGGLAFLLLNIRVERAVSDSKLLVMGGLLAAAMAILFCAWLCRQADDSPKLRTRAG